MTTRRSLQEIIDNRINIRAIVRHSVPIIYAQLDVGIDTAQATCNTCRSINNTTAGAIDASLIHRKGYRPSALDVSRYSPLLCGQQMTERQTPPFSCTPSISADRGRKTLQWHGNQRSSFDTEYIVPKKGIILHAKH